MKNNGFPESIEASDLKVGRCRQLILKVKLMKVYEYSKVTVIS